MLISDPGLQTLVNSPNKENNASFLFPALSLVWNIGDSGGPLYRWYGPEGGDRRAFLIGAVSRGSGCANFNEAGIYTRVSRVLDWIKDLTAEANCGAS